MRLTYLVLTGTILVLCHAEDDSTETDGDTSRKILGSSVVTSVSVIMDTGNKKDTIFTDAVGKPQSKPSNPSELASPIDLLNPDRYEFYTFDDNGDLVKRLMSLDEIKSIIATGDSDALDLDSFTAQGFLPEKRVSDVVNNVQSVLKEEMEILKDPISKPIFDTPDVSDTWSMILPAVFGNSGEDIKPEKPVGYVTPDTIMLEPNTQISHSTKPPQRINVTVSSVSTSKTPSISSTTKRSSTLSTYVSQPVYYSSPSLLTTKPVSSSTEPSIKVEIISNSISTTDNLANNQNAEFNPNSEVETIPTRVPALYSTSPPLMRNVSKTTSRPMTTISQINLTQASSSIKPQVTIASSSSARPTTLYAAITNQEVPVQSTSSKPITLQWSSTSLKPTSTQVNASSNKAPQVISSTLKPLKPNIFGFGTITRTTITPELTQNSTKHPTANIFGLPLSTELKVNPTTPTASSTPSVPTTLTSTITEMVSSINASSTQNLPASSLVTQISTLETAFSKTTTVKSTTQRDFMKPTTWAPNPEDAQLFNIFKEVLSQSTSEATQNSASEGSTEILNTDATNAALNFESNKIQGTDENLNTLPTEILPSTTDYDRTETTTKLPPLLSSLNDKQKISASELLDQLLLTTNIYEINTELASKFNISDVDVRFDNTSNSTEQDSEQQTPPTDRDIITYPTTTDITLIQSIEQLLFQAVDDVQTVLNQTTESTQSLFLSSKSDLYTNVAKGAETQALDFPTTSVDPEFVSTTLNNVENSATEKSDTLSESVEALLSQVNDESASLNKISITEKPYVGVTYRRVEEINSPARVTTTKPLEMPKSESNQEATTFYYVIRKNTTATTEKSTPQFINISLTSNNSTANRTKPAKADLSLEEAATAEKLKNISQMDKGYVNGTPELINELLKESVTKVISNGSTSLGTPQISNDTDEVIDLTTLESETTKLDQNDITEQYIISTSVPETTTNDERFAVEEETTEILTTSNKSVKPGATQNVTNLPKPSIVITLNENNTVVTENGKLVANKTISRPAPITISSKDSTSSATSTLASLKFEKNSTQDQTWTLVSTLAPQQAAEQSRPPPTIPYPEVLEAPAPVDLVPKPMQGFGLEESISALEVDVHQFAQLCNELAFGFWKTVTTGLSSARSIFVSPFAATSMLAMVFLGAKGATSEEMNEILKLDDMVTFNPHLTFKSVTESITSEPNSGVATAAIVRELFSDRSKGKLLDFYKNRVKAFYDGFVEEASYREIGDVIRRRSNLLVKKYTNGKYPQFINDASIVPRPPLSGVSINIFETDCSQTSTEGRDGELHFIVYPSMKQRRLVPIPAVVYKTGFLAGYEPSLDATAVSIGGKDQVVSTILVTPGQQGIAAPGDGLARLEKRLVESSFKKGAWSRLLRSLIPRPGLEVQIPRFSHKSVINATNTLQRMGLHELFNPDSADLRGLNGVANELHLSDVLQINKFATCGEKKGDDMHHSEVYPATTMRARAARRLHHIQTLDQDEPRDYQRAFHDPLYDPSLFDLPLSLRPRQARIPDIPRLRFDRPFLYFVRHNPTGLILHMGRFNPRLLP